MHRRNFLKISLGAFSAAALGAPQERWNVLFFLTDDLGWHDTAPFGNSFIDTPNLTRLAAEGARFPNAYAACPVCSPSRAAILTGKYPARLHLTDWIPGRRPGPNWKLRTPAFEQALPLDETTLAEALKPSGYRSGAIGKWHLGGEGHLPTDQGFDVNIGGTKAGQPPRYFGPIDLPGLRLEPGEFLTPRLTEEGTRFIGDSGSHPYFLYEAQFTVHMPLQAPADLVAKYKARDTWDVDPTYCAMVETADASVGGLLRTLEQNGGAGRTIVIFTSDNGGVRYQGRRAAPVTNNYPLRAGKGHLYEGGIRVPLIVRWPGLTKPGSAIEEPVIGVDYFPTLCAAMGAHTGAVDGVDIRPALRGSRLAERPLFWHYPHYSDQGGAPGGAVRLGAWKLIEFYEDGRRELFNLEEDIGERRNLVDREPARAKRLLSLLADWRRSVNASMPEPNPMYDPAKGDEGLTGYESPTEPV